MSALTDIISAVRANADGENEVTITTAAGAVTVPWFLVINKQSELQQILKSELGFELDPEDGTVRQEAGIAIALYIVDIAGVQPQPVDPSVVITTAAGDTVLPAVLTLAGFWPPGNTVGGTVTLDSTGAFTPSFTVTEDMTTADVLVALLAVLQASVPAATWSINGSTIEGLAVAPDATITLSLWAVS